MTKEELQQILIENDFLTNQNANYRSYCQDLADYGLPRKSWINSIRTKGERVKFNFLYDSTAIAAARDAAAGFSTYLTNASTRWFAIEYRKQDLKKQSKVRRFCHDVEDWCLAKLNDSNFYNTKLEWYLDEMVFGTATYSMMEDSKKFVRYNEIPVGRVNRVVDGNGDLISIYINFPLTAMQAFKMFGKNAGKSVMEALEQKKPFTEFDFVHHVSERYQREAGKSDAGNMPYRSCWIAKKDKHLISESGFMEMPYISEVFYRDASDSNGFSPMMDVFPEIKLINAMKRTVIRGAMKQVDPPYLMPSRGFVLPLNLNPAAQNYRDQKTRNDDLTTLPVGTGRIDLGVDLLEFVERKIQNRMFVDLFRSLNEVTKQMTVLETQQRISQSMAILGPVVNRFTGALGHMIIRLINMGARDPLSDFPEVPEGLEEENYDLIYLSPLAKAQRQSEIVEIQSFMNDVGAIASVMPRAIDKIDEDNLVNVLHRIRGITPEILREEDELDRRREQVAEQEQMMAQLQAGGAIAQIAKTGAEADAVSKRQPAVQK